LIGNKLAGVELSTLLEQKLSIIMLNCKQMRSVYFFHDFLCYFHMRSEIIQIVINDNLMIFYT
jgi:hypothetical protein